MYKDVAKNLGDFVIVYPKTIVPSPTKDDYISGYIDRYFIRKTNDQNGSIFEISKDVYDDYKENPFWKTATMRWRISGPLTPTYRDNGEVSDIGVLSSNKSSIGITSQILRNIGLYLPNISQFYK
jgi:hypothetical protein